MSVAPARRDLVLVGCNDDEDDDCNCRYCTGKQKFETLPPGVDGMYERKKPFLLAHADKFDEEELHRLAYFYYNTKFYGWKYPKPIMDVIGKLTEEADEFDRKMKEEEAAEAAKAAEEAKAIEDARAIQDSNKDKDDRSRNPDIYQNEDSEDAKDR